MEASIHGDAYLADGAVLEHSVHSEREGDQDNAVDRQKVDEVTEEHLLNHNWEATSDATTSRKEQKKDPAKQKWEREAFVLMTVTTSVQHEPVDREHGEADADDTVRTIASDGPLRLDTRQYTSSVVVTSHHLNAVRSSAEQVK